MIKNRNENNFSANYMLKSAFDYEIRNYIDLKLTELNSYDENTEEQLDEIRLLTQTKEYLIKRTGELKTHE
jgi:hypothetical protein